jgi:hypothetical protein
MVSSVKLALASLCRRPSCSVARSCNVGKNMTVSWGHRLALHTLSWFQGRGSRPGWSHGQGYHPLSRPVHVQNAGAGQLVGKSPEFWRRSPLPRWRGPRQERCTSPKWANSSRALWLGAMMDTSARSRTSVCTPRLLAYLQGHHGLPSEGML